MDDITKARMAWYSEEMIPGSMKGSRGATAHASGFCDVIVAERQAFLYWFMPGADKSKPVADDIVMSWDAANGIPIWRAAFAGKGVNFGVQEVSYGVYSPQLVTCYAAGAVYVFSASGRIYALRARDGKPLWESNAGRRFEALDMRLTDYIRHPEGRKGGLDKGGPPVFLDAAQLAKHRGKLGYGRSSGVVADGVLAFPDFEEVADEESKSDTIVCGLTGLDCRTGRKLWSIPGVSAGLAGMPLRWRHGGREYIISVTSGRGVCIEPKTGRIVWKMKGDLCVDTYPAVSGEYLVTTGRGIYHSRSRRDETVTAWRISPKGAKKLWSAPWHVRHDTFSGPVINSGRVYWKSKFRMVCADLRNGKILAKTKCPSWDAALIATDGRLFSGNEMFPADPARLVDHKFDDDKLLKPGLAEWTSSTVCDGRLYYRSSERVVCWDLRREPTGGWPPVVRDIISITSAKEAAGSLAARDLRMRKTGRDLLFGKPEWALSVLDELVAAVKSDRWQHALGAAEVMRRHRAQSKRFTRELTAAAEEMIGMGEAARAALLAGLVVELDPAMTGVMVGAAGNALRGEPPRVLQAACSVLARLGPRAASAAPVLVRVMSEGDERQAAWVAEALAAMGGAAADVAPDLVRLIREAPGSERALLAARVLDSIGVKAEPIKTELVEAFLVSEGPTRFWVSETLTKIGSDTVPALVARVTPFIESEAPAGANPPHPKYRLLLLVDTVKTIRNQGAAATRAMPFMKGAAQVIRKEGGRHFGDFADRSLELVSP
ncbi:PQQ-binding-like beta-propeller repeat protein [Verrucomicrobiota bacterium]